jgi:hypothetical protein
MQAAVAEGRLPQQALAAAAPAIDPRVLQAWTQFSTDEAQFSTAHLVSVASGGAPCKLDDAAPTSAS